MVVVERESIWTAKFLYNRGNSYADRTVGSEHGEHPEGKAGGTGFDLEQFSRSDPVHRIFVLVLEVCSVLYLFELSMTILLRSVCAVLTLMSMVSALLNKDTVSSSLLSDSITKGMTQLSICVFFKTIQSYTVQRDTVGIRYVEERVIYGCE